MAARILLATRQRLRRECGLPLVLNAPYPIRVEGAETHVSGIRGLIHATRRAAAVVGVDSGPMHLAAALGKPGVAIYGPTDPARNGPYGGTFTVLRSPAAVTTYKRTEQPDASMREITPDQVFEALEAILSAASKRGETWMSVFPKPYADVVARLRVARGFVLVRRSPGSREPDFRSLACGLPVSLLGLLLRAWATGHLEKNIRLAESGPYAYVRNPLYLGNAAGGGRIGDCVATMAAGGAVRRGLRADLSAGDRTRRTASAPAFSRTSTLTRNAFRRCGRPSPARSERRFQWSLYVRNREYQALLGFLAGVAFLIAKVWVLEYVVETSRNPHLVF